MLISQVEIFCNLKILNFESVFLEVVEFADIEQKHKIGHNSLLKSYQEYNANHHYVPFNHLIEAIFSCRRVRGNAPAPPPTNNKKALMPLDLKEKTIL